MQALLFCYNLDEAAVLQLVLQRAGFEVRSVSDMDRAIDNWPARPAELILLAFGAAAQIKPGLLERFRGQTPAPIVVVSEQLADDLQVALLESGGDLIITRPYSTRFLTAQIRALMRRAAGMPFFSLPILSQAGLQVDPSNRTLQVNEGPPIRLTQLEFRLLFTLMTHAGRVIPSEKLVEYVWGYGGEGNRGLVRGLVQRLRSKIEYDPAQPDYILTEKGIGYCFNPSLSVDGVDKSQE